MAVLRFALVLALILVFATIGLPLHSLAVRFRWGWRRRLPQMFHRSLVWILHIRTRVQGHIAAPPALLVANHVSWVDISLLGALAPLCFVAKDDVARWPVFGALARAQQSIFVNRKRRMGVRKVNLEMADRLMNGQRVVLFPEGTTGDGNRLLPFFTSHFAVTREVLRQKDDISAVAVQPVSIAYHRRHGLVMDRNARSSIAWYGDTSLLPHLWSLLKGGPVDAIVTFGEQTAVDIFENRKIFAQKTAKTIQGMNYQALYGRGEIAGAKANALALTSSQAPQKSLT